MKIRPSKYKLDANRRIVTNELAINPFESQAQRAACYAKKDPNWDCEEWEKVTPKGKKLPKRKTPAENMLRLKRLLLNKGRSKDQRKSERKSERKSGKVIKKKGPNPLRSDPTRTRGMIRAFMVQVKKQFALLKGQIVKLVVDEDAFGLKEKEPFVANFASGPLYRIQLVGGEMEKIVTTEQLLGAEPLLLNYEGQPRDENGRFGSGGGVAKGGPDYEEPGAPTTNATTAEIDAAAAQADPNPTEAQISAGNYQKGHVTIQGLPITIETAAGNKRKPWHEKPVQCHYGYIRFFEGTDTTSKADGDHVDVFIGPNPDSEIVFVVDQNKDDGSFDEHKVMLAFTNEDEAVKAYHDSYEDGWQGFAGVKALSMQAFKNWLHDGDTGKPVVDQLVVNTNIVEVPDVRQEHHYDCGAACSASVGMYFNVGPKTLDGWIKALGTDVEESTRPGAIVGYLRSLGLSVKEQAGMTLDDLEAYTEQGHPVLICCQDYGPEVPEKARFSYGHYIVIIGVVRSGDSTYVVAQDPSEDNVVAGGDKKALSETGSIQKPGRILIDGNDFTRLWHDKDSMGNKYIRWGAAVGPGLTGEVQNYEGQPRDDHGRFGNTFSATVAKVKSVTAKIDALSNKVPIVRTIKPKMQALMNGIHKRLESRYGSKAATAIMVSGSLGGYGVMGAALLTTGTPGIPFVNDLVSIAVHTAVAEFGLQLRRGYKVITGNEELIENVDQQAVQSVKSQIADMVRYLQLDLRDELLEAVQDKDVADLARRLAKPTTNYDPDQPRDESVTTNTRFAFHTSADKVKAFQDWLKTQLQSYIVGKTQDDLWAAFIKAGYEKGAGQAYDSWSKSKLAKMQASGQVESPMDWYQGGREQFLKSSFNQPVSVEKVKLLAGRTFDELENVTDGMSNDMSRTLVDGMIQGQHPLDIAQDMADKVDIAYSRAETICRTELARAHAEGSLHALEDMGVEEVGVAVEFSDSGDNAVCERCAVLAGVVFKLDEAHGVIPVHPNCVVGGTVVSGLGFLSVICAQYTGVIHDLATSDGRRLSATSHHVLLTQRGWVFAKDIKDSDYLVNAPVTESILPSLVIPDHNYTDPTIGQVFESLIKVLDESRISETLCVAHDLHGDGVSVDKKVKIVRVESVLWDERYTSLLAHPVKSFLGWRDVATSQSFGLYPQCPLSYFLERLAFTADSLVRCFGVSDILRARSLTHHEPIGVSLVSRYIPAPGQDFVDSSPLEAESLGKTVDTFAMQKELDDLVRGKLVKIEGHSTRHVTNLQVYDASTQSTLYAANGFLTSNCRCTFFPANVGEDDSNQKSTKTEIDDALEDAGLDATVSKDRPESIVNQLSENAFCPTGVGGGIDATCSPRPAAPKTFQEAKGRFNDVSEKVFGDDGGGMGTVWHNLDGGRHITAYIEDDPGVVKLDFGVEGREDDSVSGTLERESLPMLRKVREAVKAFHEAGFKMLVKPAESRRASAYSKMLKKMGLKFESSSDTGEVWNVVIDEDTTENAFCATGKGGGVDATCSTGSQAKVRWGESRQG